MPPEVPLPAPDTPPPLFTRREALIATLTAAGAGGGAIALLRPAPLPTVERTHPISPPPLENEPPPRILSPEQLKLLFTQSALTPPKDDFHAQRIPVWEARYRGTDARFTENVLALQRAKNGDPRTYGEQVAQSFHQLNSSGDLATIIDILTKASLPIDFLFLAAAESHLRSAALSSAGARGHWQFMPNTATSLGLSITPELDERTDLLKSTEAASRYLASRYQLLKKWEEALSLKEQAALTDADRWSYVCWLFNGGEGTIRKTGVYSALKGKREGYSAYMEKKGYPENAEYLAKIIAIRTYLKEVFINSAFPKALTTPPRKTRAELLTEQFTLPYRIPHSRGDFHLTLTPSGVEATFADEPLPLTSYRVSSGDTLKSISVKIAPHPDMQSAIEQLIQLVHPDLALRPRQHLITGESLLLPRFL